MVSYVCVLMQTAGRTTFAVYLYACNADCMQDYFHCRGSDRCLPSHQICDGHDDCGDNSDETGCGEFHFSCLFLIFFSFVFRSGSTRMFHVCFLYVSGMFLVVTLVCFMYVSSSGSTYIFHVCFLFVSGIFLVLA